MNPANEPRQIRPVTFFKDGEDPSMTGVKDFRPQVAPESPAPAPTSASSILVAETPEVAPGKPAVEVDPRTPPTRDEPAQEPAQDDSESRARKGAPAKA